MERSNAHCEGKMRRVGKGGVSRNENLDLEGCRCCQRGIKEENMGRRPARARIGFLDSTGGNPIVWSKPM